MWRIRSRAGKASGKNAPASLEGFPSLRGRRFIRPVHDSKLFSGTVMSWAEIEEWRKKMLNGSDGSASLDLTIPVMASSVKQTSLEPKFYTNDFSRRSQE